MHMAYGRPTLPQHHIPHTFPIAPEAPPPPFLPPSPQSTFKTHAMPTPVISAFHRNATPASSFPSAAPEVCVAALPAASDVEVVVFAPPVEFPVPPVLFVKGAVGCGALPDDDAAGGAAEDT